MHPVILWGTAVLIDATLNRAGSSEGARRTSPEWPPRRLLGPLEHDERARTAAPVVARMASRAPLGWSCNSESRNALMKELTHHYRNACKRFRRRCRGESRIRSALGYGRASGNWQSVRVLRTHIGSFLGSSLHGCMDAAKGFFRVARSGLNQPHSRPRNSAGKGIVDSAIDYFRIRS
jgi:hypothetical protein